MPIRQRLSWRKLIGIDSHFTRVDTFVATFIFLWSMIQVLALLSTAGWQWLAPVELRWTNAAWANFWFWLGLVIPGIFTLITFVWFSIGGYRDMRAFFHALRAQKSDAHDDGLVVKPAASPDKQS